MREHVVTVDGAEVELTIQPPKQSRCLEYTARIASIDDGDVVAHYDAALAFVGPHATIADVQDVADWLDTHVPFGETVQLAGRVLTSRMPSVTAQGK
jgi:hypothetical protein